VKFNKKLFNWSAWITVIIAYVFPYQSKDGIATNFGYPFSFLIVYKVPINRSLNLPAFAFNILIIYSLITFATVLLVKHKSNGDKDRINL